MSGRPRSDELLLGALAAGSSVDDAAAAAGMSVRTAYRRLADARFKARLTAAREEIVAAALGALVQHAPEAVATLARLLGGREERVQLGAAKAILDQLLRLREATLLEQRLATLERTQQARRGGSR